MPPAQPPTPPLSQRTWNFGLYVTVIIETALGVSHTQGQVMSSDLWGIPSFREEAEIAQ